MTRWPSSALGPIGLAALLTAQFYSPAAVLMIDLDENRLRVAQGFGATTLINSADGKSRRARDGRHRRRRR